MCVDSIVHVRDLQRGAVKLHILHHAARAPVNGAWMSDELANHGHAISPGTLYPTLHRMESDGWLVSERTVADGRTRRDYSITPAGRGALHEGRRMLRELADELLRTAPPT